MAKKKKDGGSGTGEGVNKSEGFQSKENQPQQ